MNTKRAVPRRQVSTAAEGSDPQGRSLRGHQFAIRYVFLVQLISILGLLVGCGGSSTGTTNPTPNPSPTPTPTVSNGHFRALKTATAQQIASAVRPYQTNTPTSTMTYPRVYATATLLSDGRVLIAGGTNGPEGMNDPTGPWASSAEIFDPATETFLLLNSQMSWQRINHCAVTLSNGKVVLIGGWAEDKWYNQSILPSTVDLFDPGTNSFISQSISGPLPDTFGANPPGCFLLSGDHIFINSDYSGPMVLDTNTWTTHEIQVSGVPTGYKPVYSSATQTPDGKVWIVGGQPGPQDNVTLSDVMRFDPADESASIVGHLTQRRAFAGILPFPDNSIEVYGGAYVDDSGSVAYITSVERITSAGTAIKIGDLPRAKLTFTPVMLQNGKSLQAGGSDGVQGIETDTQYVFDETTHVSGVTGDMIEKRRFFAVTPLNTGRVLMAGGDSLVSGASSGINSAEIFEPDANLYILIPKTTVAPGEFVQLSAETSLSGTVTWAAKYGTVTSTGGYTAPTTFPFGPRDIPIVSDEVTATLPTGEKAVAPIRIVFPDTSAP